MDRYPNAQLLISADELARMLAAGGSPLPLILDLRPSEAYSAGHVPGAIDDSEYVDFAPKAEFLELIDGVRKAMGG